MAERLTEELLDELLETPRIEEYLDTHALNAPSLAEYLNRQLTDKRLKRSEVVRMANLNETFGYQIFTGSRNPSRDKVLQIAFAMAPCARPIAPCAPPASRRSTPRAGATPSSSSASIAGVRSRR